MSQLGRTYEIWWLKMLPWRGPYQYGEPNRGNINKAPKSIKKNSSVICQTTTIKFKDVKLKLENIT